MSDASHSAHPGQAFCAAMRLLCIAPLPGAWGESQQARRASLLYFPLAGALLGAVLAGATWVCGALLPTWPAACLTIVAMTAISGALHLDGLCDTADAFLSSRSRERKLEIMKDSHIGVMGVMALWTVLMLKTVALASLPVAWRWTATPTAVVAGRCAMAMAMNALPYARGNQGLGADFYHGRSLRVVAISLGTLLAICLGFYAWYGAFVATTTLAALLLFIRSCRRTIGGATGDTLGATCELTETCVLLSVCVLWHWNS